MTKNRMELVRQIRKWLEEDADDMLREMLRLFAQVLMGAEADEHCGAERGSRSPDRVNHRNGYRSRRWDTRVGTIDLMIPKLRKGTYFPDFLLEPRRRSERALVNVIAESYVNGVSTRKTEKLVEAMGIIGISKSQVSEMAKTLDKVVADFRNRSLEDLEYPIVWLDAMQIRTREVGQVVKVATVIATAVSSEGHREIIGVDVFTSEDEAAWGPSSTQERVRFVASAVFNLPWRLTLSPVVEYGSGQPWNRQLGYDANGDAGTGGFADRAPSVDRNDQDGPSYRQVNLRLTKTLDLGRGELDLIVEAFNLFDTANYDVNTVDNAEFLLDLSGGAPGFARNPRFGEYLDTLQPFEIQLGARYRF